MHDVMRDLGIMVNSQGEDVGMTKKVVLVCTTGYDSTLFQGTLKPMLRMHMLRLSMATSSWAVQ